MNIGSNMSSSPKKKNKVQFQTQVKEKYKDRVPTIKMPIVNDSIGVKDIDDSM